MVLVVVVQTQKRKLSVRHHRQQTDVAFNNVRNYPLFVWGWVAGIAVSSPLAGIAVESLFIVDNFDCDDEFFLSSSDIPDSFIISITARKTKLGNMSSKANRSYEELTRPPCRGAFFQSIAPCMKAS